MTTESHDNPGASPVALGSTDGLGPLVVGGVTFEALRIPVFQVSKWLPRELHVYSRDAMELAASAARREEREQIAADLEAQAEWVPCDCGCPGKKAPKDARAVGWIRAAARVRAGPNVM